MLPGCGSLWRWMDVPLTRLLSGGGGSRLTTILESSWTLVFSPPSTPAAGRVLAFLHVLALL